MHRLSLPWLVSQIPTAGPLTWVWTETEGWPGRDVGLSIQALTKGDHERKMNMKKFPKIGSGGYMEALQKTPDPLQLAGQLVLQEGPNPDEAWLPPLEPGCLQYQRAKGVRKNSATNTLQHHCSPQQWLGTTSLDCTQLKEDMPGSNTLGCSTGTSKLKGCLEASHQTWVPERKSAYVYTQVQYQKRNSIFWCT